MITLYNDRRISTFKPLENGRLFFGNPVSLQLLVLIKCNFPMNPNVHPLVGRLVVRLVGRSICPNCLKGREVKLCLSEHLFLSRSHLPEAFESLS